MKIDINYEQLKNRCTEDIESFNILGDTVNTRDGKYIYIDRGGKVLAVAHLDIITDILGWSSRSYPRRPSFEVVESIGEYGVKTIIRSEALDDRLGVYIILDLLPKLGLTYDILLTEGEEIGCSTAAHFEAVKEYNWLFSFDRMGDGVVLYQYECEETTEMCLKHGFEIYEGIYSDICYLDHLGVAGFNFGTGYYENHSSNSYAIAEVITGQVEKFLSFWDEYRDRKVEVSEVQWSFYRYHWRRLWLYLNPSETKKKRKKRERDWEEGEVRCDICGRFALSDEFAIIDDMYMVCRECQLTSVFNCEYCGRSVLYRHILYAPYGELICDDCAYRYGVRATNPES